MKRRVKRIIRTSVLPGEPLDGSGRACIHLFVQDERGPYVEPHVLHPVIGEDGQVVKQRLEARPTRGRLACDPKRDPSPVVRGNVTIVTDRTDNPSAVTCPKCLATKECAEILKKYNNAEAAQ